MDTTVIAAISAGVGLVLAKVFDFCLSWYKEKKAASVTDEAALLQQYKDLVVDLKMDDKQYKLAMDAIKTELLNTSVENAKLKEQLAGCQKTNIK